MKIIRKEISTASNKPWHYKTSLLLFFKKNITIGYKNTLLRVFWNMVF